MTRITEDGLRAVIRAALDACESRSLDDKADRQMVAHVVANHVMRYAELGPPPKRKVR